MNVICERLVNILNSYGGTEVAVKSTMRYGVVLGEITRM